MTAVHGHEVNVAIYKQVTFGRPAIKHQWLFVPRFPDLDETFSPLSVMVVITVWVVLIENPRSDHALHFPFRHFPVQRISNDNVNIINAMACEHVQDNLRDFDFYRPAIIEDFGKFIRATKIPVLAICGGHQLVGLTVTTHRYSPSLMRPVSLC